MLVRYQFGQSREYMVFSELLMTREGFPFASVDLLRCLEWRALGTGSFTFERVSSNKKYIVFQDLQTWQKLHTKDQSDIYANYSIVLHRSPL